MPDLLHATAQTLVIEPPARMGSPVVTWIDVSGSASAVTSAIDAVSTTISAGGTASSFAVVSATGVTVGRRYEVADPTGWTFVVRVAKLSGTTVTLEGALPSAPTAGATFKGVDISCTITTTHTATRGVGYRLRVVSGAADWLLWVNVVRHLFSEPATASDCLDYLNRITPSHGRSMEACRTFAERATSMVRLRLMGQGRYPHLQGDASAFREAGRLALRYVLARDDGRFPPHTADPEQFLRDADQAWRVAVADAVQSLIPYDRGDDDAVPQTHPRIGSVSLRRTA